MLLNQIKQSLLSTLRDNTVALVRSFKVRQDLLPGLVSYLLKNKCLVKAGALGILKKLSFENIYLKIKATFVAFIILSAQISQAIFDLTI